jgi:alpha/beta hydrolase fold
VVTLTGVGGVGKTALAIETAWSEVAAGRAERACHVDLVPCRTGGRGTGLIIEEAAFGNRGCGGSEAPPAPYSVTAMAADTAALIEHLGLGLCVVIGYSLGGYIAQELAVTRADLIRRLVLLAGAGPRRRGTSARNPNGARTVQLIA